MFPGSTRSASFREATPDVLLKILQALSDSDDLADLIAVVRKELSKFIDTRNFFLALCDEGGTYSFPYFVDEFDDLRELQPQQMSRSLTDYVRRTGRALLVDEDQHDQLVRAGEVDVVGTPSPHWLGVPLKGSQRVLGVLAVQSYSRRTVYSQTDLEVLSSISRHIALAIERKQVEAALFESEQRFRSFQDACGDGIVFHDGATILDANEGMTRLCGYGLPELVGQNPLILVVPEHRARVAELMQRGGEREFEMLGLRKDGSTLPVAVRASDVPYCGSAARVALVRDLTAQQDATRALKESEERYRGLFESSPEAIFVSNVEGELEDLNSAAVELFGFSSKEEFLAADPQELFENPADRMKLRELLDERGKIKDYELRLKTKRGEPLIVLDTSEALKSATGVVVGCRRWLRDVTEARSLERQFLQAQKMEAVGRLAGGIAHDFGNLLTVINGYVELLAASLAPGDPTREGLETIGEAGVRAAKLVGQLLAFGRRLVLQPRVVDLNEVIRKFSGLMSRAVGEDTTVTMSLARTACLVKADVGQLEQVLMNLAVNARDAMPRGGELVIETWCAEFEEGRTIGQVPISGGKYSVVAVSDNGSGMDSGELERIFEPFFTTKSKGTGLGLATVFGIVKQSGGYIFVDSEPGAGTTFTVYLPRLDQEPESEATDVETKLPNTVSATVLVVDDDLGVCSFVEAALERFGCTVRTANEAEGALRICREAAEPIDLMLTDRVMPGMRGTGLAKLARRLQPQMQIVYMTGHIDGPQSPEDCSGTGDSLLRKPISVRRLEETVWKALQRGRGESFDSGAR